MKNLIIALAVAIIMQSCKAYSKSSVSFNQAYQSQQKVIMVKSKSNFSLNILERGLFQKKFHLSKIYTKNGKYYGKIGIIRRIRIDPNRDVFYLQTDKINPWTTTALVIGIVGIAAILAISIVLISEVDFTYSVI